MDNQPNPKPFNPPQSPDAVPTPASTAPNPYDTEISPESIEHTPEQPRSPLSANQSTTPPSAQEARSQTLPHKPHHFATKNAVILGVLFLLTAGLSSVITFALVNSRAQKQAPVEQAPVSKVTPTPDPMAGWQTYTDVMGTYSIKYPVDFQVYNPTNSTTLIGAADQIALYKQGELAPDTTSKPSIVTVEILPSKIYTPPSGAVIETIALAGKEFSKITNEDISGITSVEYIYSDTEHFYRLTYLKGANDESFENIINSFAFADTASTSPSGSMTACTMDAKVCSDGSSVGRVPPSCEFAACP